MQLVVLALLLRPMSYYEELAARKIEPQGLCPQNGNGEQKCILPQHRLLVGL